ncbi:SusC/RagA family TonB-linked outer membrane protein [Segetibacter sp.]|jgi:TonB-linked SusC/RagA family outer membrane protein|uniref:SusC/RagA family TonB-linked outer membrane protein n=1 Tax=Segetibacter sp. TaxID=2231182 RepID=UPI0026285E63|nr:SusC/RagA family TonB-linked outer membrane protein [Segetibacter sp.]MCW3080891.1 SusC/RagA family TonB-linked outer membrane protein [Segetibacter sp.]
MLKHLCRVFFLLLLCQTQTIAQTLRITGKVTDAEHTPLSGVSVVVSGSNQGTTTDSKGDYSISAPSNGTLVFTSIGFGVQNINIQGKSVIDLQLSSDAKTLNTVVVTALGLQRSSKSITYATQNVSGEELNRVKSPNLINALAGKAAGVVITAGNGPGSSSRVLLRGSKSITGNNQPLYVIDGIPMSNANGPQSGGIAFTRDGGDAISNLNPEDIESLQILKGASAAALYGSQAANGVIIITTKKGRRGVAAVTFSSTAMFSNPLVLPEIQTSYGQGAGGNANTAINDSWGPKITTGSDTHLKDFFVTGTDLINSLSVTNGNEVSQFYLSYANTSSKGIVPQNTYYRHNINLRGSTRVFDKVTIDASINYINQNAKNRPGSGWNNSPLFSLYLFPVGDNFSRYSGANYQRFDPARNMFVQNWPYVRNEASSNQNPYWIQNRIQSEEKRSRGIYALSGKWDIAEGLNFQARGTYDRAADHYEQRLHASSDPINVGNNGGYTTNPTTTEQLYSDVLLSGNKKIKEAVSLSGTVGFSNTVNTFHSLNLGTNGANTTLAYPNFFSAYALQGNFVHTESLQKRVSRAVFATATVGYKETVFLDATARNEWSSTVPQSFFYPSVGVSYVLTQNIGTSNILSFAKLRGSYAEVGNALPFGVANLNPNYSLAVDGNINGRTALPFFSGTDTSQLKPERTRSYELGAELRFFKDKLSLNVTYYHATTFDQVFQIGAPAGSGTTNFWINGGTILNKGVEAIASYNGQIGKVRWTPTLNFSKNVNQIRELSNLLVTDRFVLNSGFRLTQLFLSKPGSPTLGGREYGAYGDIFGRTYLRDDKGGMQYNATTGLPLVAPANDRYLGNSNPNFLLGFNNSFNYKSFVLSFLIDSRFGGQIASSTEQWLDFKGLSKRSGEARDNGGVMVNGKLIPAETYYQYISGKADIAAAAEEYVFDATNIRFRELAIGFSLPPVTKAIKNMTLSLIGRNLLIFYKKAPFDPEISISTANALQGIEGFSMPSQRSVGVSLKVTL